MNEQTKLAYSRLEAAKALGISDRTLDAWVRQGKIEVVKVNRKVLIPAQNLKKLLEKN